jgi:zinc transporter ZupT
MEPVMSAATVVAAPANSAGPGVLGFLVVVALGFIVFVLYRSMNKHLRRVPKHFDDSQHS